MQQSNSQLIGYIGYPAPEGCTVEDTHLSPIYVSCNIPFRVTNVPIAADTPIAYHACVADYWGRVSY